MKIFAAMLMMGTAVGAWGQSPATSDLIHTRTEATTAIVDCSKALPLCPKGQTCSCVQPLKCGKYQHVEPSRLGCAVGDDVGYCDRIIPAQCADDMHMVTEREWQDLAARMKVLEDVAHFVLRPKP